MSKSNIEERVSLFNRAYPLAWGQVSQAVKAKEAGVSEGLATAIRKQITTGSTDPVEIAAAALSELLEGLRGDSGDSSIQSPGGWEL